MTLSCLDRDFVFVFVYKLYVGQKKWMGRDLYIFKITFKIFALRFEIDKKIIFKWAASSFDNHIYEND